MSGYDPLHELLINTSDRELSVANPQEYHDRAKELLQSTEALSSSLTLLYSERIERKLAKLQKFMVGRLGRRIVNYESEIEKFFDGKYSVFALKLGSISRL